MIGSLYVRVVLIFLLAIVAGIVIAFSTASTIFEKQLSEDVYKELKSISDDLVSVYVNTADQGVDTLRNNVQALSTYSIRIMNQSGDVFVQNAKDSSGDIPVTPEEADRVLSGGTLLSDENDHTIVGRPFRLHGENYALFIMPFDPNNVTLAKVLLTFLLILLGVGSLIFVIAVRFLVTPIRSMTKATEQMARGDFSVELNLSRKDELGMLAQSFDRMARELRQIEQMRQDFVSNVSHEMQSPLTSITGFAKALRDGIVSGEHRERYLDIIAAESERLSRLSDNLLHLASLESEHHPFDPKQFALDEQIRKVVVALEPHWAEKRIGIELDLPVVRIAADQDQLNQVWVNLLGNAIKFTPEEGQVRVGLRRTVAGDIAVTIADTGIGIAPGNVKHIFDRFFKADRSRNRSRTGSGLGLAIVKKIVDLHGGDIRVSSTPGKGTSIEIILPASVHSTRPHPSAATTPLPM